MLSGRTGTPRFRMRLLAITCAFLGLRRIHASPPFCIDGIGSHVEKISPSGHFDNPELQQRALRFLNQATARTFCALMSRISRLTSTQLLLSTAALFPTLPGMLARVTQVSFPSAVRKMRQEGSSSGFSRATTPSQETRLWSGASDMQASNANCANTLQ